MVILDYVYLSEAFMTKLLHDLTFELRSITRT